MEEPSYHFYKTPFGIITIESAYGRITQVRLGKVELKGTSIPNKEMNRCATELLEYFSGRRRVFDIDISIEGTDFQKSVWKECSLIPYGQTSTPKDVAIAIGAPKSYRAVGSAIKENPLAILVPAHRVVLSSGYVNKKDRSSILRAAFRELERKHCDRSS